MKVILPKKGANIPADNTHPIFFLAGPVVGGGDWQERIYREIDHKLKLWYPAKETPVDDAYIAIPQRYWTEHHLVKHRVADGEVYDRQLDWERHYMQRAAWGPGPGCLIFWLEPQKDVRDPKNGPYAQDTYGEIGRWVTHKKYQPETRLVIGGHQGFPGISSIEDNIVRDLGRKLMVYKYLDMMLDTAIKTAFQS